MLHESLCLETPLCCLVLLVIGAGHLMICVSWGLSAIKTELILFGVKPHWLVLGGVIRTCRACTIGGNAEATSSLRRWAAACLWVGIAWCLRRVRVYYSDGGSSERHHVLHIFHVACLLVPSKRGRRTRKLVTLSPPRNLLILKVPCSTFLERSGSWSENTRLWNRHIWVWNLILFMSVIVDPHILRLGLERQLGDLTSEVVVMIILRVT